MIPPSWQPGENGFVAEGAVVGVGSTMRHNCWIGPRAIIGPNVKLGHSVWIGPGAILGDGVVVGDNTSIGAGAIVGDQVIIGRQCELLIAQEYRDPVADRTFYSRLFSEPVRIYGRPQRASGPLGK
jgi:UDP-3-O-[3-hydroxymyristoyl] glucosamine N-acyltransferase